MKKIINWTFGSVFRTLGRILAYIGVGMLFALILSKNNVKLTDLLGIEKVSAATTITPSEWGSKVNYLKNNLTLNTSEQIASNWLTGDYTNFCSNSGGYTYNCYLLNNWYYVKLSTSLDAGKTYTMNFSTYNTNRGTQTYYNKSTYTMIASNTGAYNGSSSSNISSFSCRAGIAEGTQSRVDWSCSFTPATAINYIYMNIKFDTGNPLFSSYSVSRASLSYDNSQTDAINQQTNIIQNQTDIINNNITDSTNQIINGLNGLEESLTENQKVCNTLTIDKSYIKLENKYMNSSGTISNSESYGITDFIKVDRVKVLNYFNGSAGTCFYKQDKTLINCIASNQTSDNQVLSLPTETYYMRVCINVSQNKPIYEIESCKNGNQALNDTLTDDNTSDAQNEASSFFENFTTNTHGLTSIITAPLTAIESLTSKTCSPLVLPLPFVDEDLTLPCMRPIYEENFGGFMTLYDAITLGIVSYWILVRIFALVKDFKNPDHDEIEVVDL